MDLHCDHPHRVTKSFAKRRHRLGLSPKSLTVGIRKALLPCFQGGYLFFVVRRSYPAGISIDHCPLSAIKHHGLLSATKYHTQQLADTHRAWFSSYLFSFRPISTMADVEMQDAGSAKDKVAKTSKSGAGEASEGKKRFEVKKVSGLLFFL